MAKLLPANDPAAKELDKDLKNKFRWSWLGESADNIQFDCFVKIALPGKVLCTLCNDQISYSSNGKRALAKHVMHPKHLKVHKARQDNMQLVISPADHVIATVPPPQNTPRPVPLCDRIAQDQVCISNC